jgi:hypothetical protein
LFWKVRQSWCWHLRLVRFNPPPHPVGLGPWSTPLSMISMFFSRTPNHGYRRYPKFIMVPERFYLVMREPCWSIAIVTQMKSRSGFISTR